MRVVQLQAGMSRQLWQPSYELYIHLRARLLWSWNAISLKIYMCKFNPDAIIEMCKHHGTCRNFGQRPWFISSSWSSLNPMCFKLWEPMKTGGGKPTGSPESRFLQKCKCSYCFYVIHVPVDYDYPNSTPHESTNESTLGHGATCDFISFISFIWRWFQYFTMALELRYCSIRERSLMGWKGCSKKGRPGPRNLDSKGFFPCEKSVEFGINISPNSFLRWFRWSLKFLKHDF